MIKGKVMEHKELILEFLGKNRLMSLATCTKNTPWAATVFFAYDIENLDLFFFSRPDTKHCTDIAANPLVAVTFNQFWGEKMSVKGLQIVGRASRVLKGEGLVRSYAIFLKRHPWAALYAADHTLYVIHPDEIHHINQEAFGHFNRVRVK